MSNTYYSGQGSLYAAQRNAAGQALGFIPLGNVPALEIAVEVSKFDHKEAESGQRAIDLTLIQEKKGTFTMTMESLNPTNLAMAFWGSNQTIAAGSITDLVVIARVSATVTALRIPIENAVTGVTYAGVSNVVVGDNTTPTVTYEFGTTPTAAGSLNGWVDEANGTLIIFDTATQTSKGAAANIVEGQDLYLDFDNAASEVIHAFTDTSQERWLRFEGLNTVDDTRVIIDIFKANLDPLAGYGLINEELAAVEITGSVLYDANQLGTSKFFRQVNAG